MPTTNAVNAAAISTTRKNLRAEAGAYVVELAFRYGPTIKYVWDCGKAALVAGTVTNLAIASPVAACAATATLGAVYAYEQYYKDKNHEMSCLLTGSILYGVEVLSRLNVITGMAASVVALSDPAVNLTRAAFMAVGLALPLETVHLGWMGFRLACHSQMISQPVASFLSSAGHQAIEFFVPTTSLPSMRQFFSRDSLNGLGLYAGNALLHRGWNWLLAHATTLKPAPVTEYLKQHAHAFVDQFTHLLLAVTGLPTIIVREWHKHPGAEYVLVQSTGAIRDELTAEALEGWVIFPPEEVARLEAELEQLQADANRWVLVSLAKGEQEPDEFLGMPVLTATPHHASPVAAAAPLDLGASWVGDLTASQVVQNGGPAATNANTL